MDEVALRDAAPATATSVQCEAGSRFTGVVVMLRSKLWS